MTPGANIMEMVDPIIAIITNNTNSAPVVMLPKKNITVLIIIVAMNAAKTHPETNRATKKKNHKNAIKTMNKVATAFQGIVTSM